MKTLLISYTTLVAFLVLSVVGGILMPSTNHASTASKTLLTSTAPSCHKWDFNGMPDGKITSLSSPQQIGTLKPVTLSVSWVNNKKTATHPNMDYANNPFDVVDVKVINPAKYPYTDDLNIAPNNKVVIMDGGSHAGKYVPGTVRDAHAGGNLVLHFSEGSNVTQVKYRTIDMGDEYGDLVIPNYPGSEDRINNNYTNVWTSDGKMHKIGMSFSGQDKSNLPNKFVWDHPSMDYGANIKVMAIHFSGSAGLDDLEICNKPLPTSTPTNTPTPTKTPTPTITPTTAPKSCVQYGSKTFKSIEFNASKPNLVSSDLGTVSFNALAKKYPITVNTFWGWTGIVGGNMDQTGPGTKKQVQNNERHNVLIKYNDNQSKATKTETMVCDDLGNTKWWNDGDKTLSVGTFHPCRKGIGLSGNVYTPELNNGAFSGVKLVNLQGKYDSISLTSKLLQTETYEQCKARLGHHACAQSHYSQVKVTYCVKEG